MSGSRVVWPRRKRSSHRGESWKVCLVVVPLLISLLMRTHGLGLMIHRSTYTHTHTSRSCVSTTLPHGVGGRPSFGRKRCWSAYITAEKKTSKSHANKYIRAGKYSRVKSMKCFVLWKVWQVLIYIQYHFGDSLCCVWSIWAPSSFHRHLALHTWHHALWTQCDNIHICMDMFTVFIECWSPCLSFVGSWFCWWVLCGPCSST